MAGQRSKSLNLLYAHRGIDKLRQSIYKRLIVQIDVTASSHRDQIHYTTASSLVKRVLLVKNLHSF